MTRLPNFKKAPERAVGILPATAGVPRHRRGKARERLCESGQDARGPRPAFGAIHYTPYFLA